MSIIETVKINIEEVTAEGYDFRGCNDTNPDYCACGDDTEVLCERCSEPIEDGQLIRQVTIPETWHDLSGNYELRTWHVECPDPEES